MNCEHYTWEGREWCDSTHPQPAICSNCFRSIPTLQERQGYDWYIENVLLAPGAANCRKPRRSFRGTHWVYGRMPALALRWLNAPKGYKL